MHFSTISVIYRCSQFESFAPHVEAADFVSALRHVEECLSCDDASDSRDTLALMLLSADLMLVLERDEEAEERLLQAVKLSSSQGKVAVRFMAGWATACMRLSQQNYPMAVACFEQLLTEDAHGCAQEVEALCGLAFSRHALGQSGRALRALAEAKKLLGGNQDGRRPGLDALVALSEMQILVSSAVRQQPDMDDHVRWQLEDATACPDDAIQAAHSAIERARHISPGNMLVERHALHLQHVLALCEGKDQQGPEGEAIHRHLLWLRRIGLRSAEREARIGAALAAVARRRCTLARSLIQPLLSAEAPERWRQSCGLDLSYCLVRICMHSGLIDQALVHYQHYTREAIRLTRHALSTQRFLAHDEGDAASVVQVDAIEVRLPARYRRAYRYMIERLNSSELSVREIADAIGVTERALQMAFKSFAGMTPGEAIQRARVERIRAELLHAESADMSIVETAARWGIRNRSTLVAAYRRHFQETPTQTLARAHAQAQPLFN